jgi:CheY-like chemotaxis protein
MIILNCSYMKKCCGVKRRIQQTLRDAMDAANAFEDDKQNALKAGMNGHIAKPLNFEELSKILQQWL